jgi:dTDP-4-amino-4,6-dideoxygalactose transaminase
MPLSPSGMLRGSVKSHSTCVYTLTFYQGVIPVVVEAHSADVIATLILLKKEVEEKTGAIIQMTIAGATEAHLLVKEIAEAKIGVIFKPSRPFPATWERRRL